MFRQTPKNDFVFSTVAMRDGNFSFRRTWISFLEMAHFHFPIHKPISYQSPQVISCSIFPFAYRKSRFDDNIDRSLTEDRLQRPLTFRTFLAVLHDALFRLKGRRRTRPPVTVEIQPERYDCPREIERTEGSAERETEIGCSEHAEKHDPWFCILCEFASKWQL
jgi:hypothetical protein